MPSRSLVRALAAGAGLVAVAAAVALLWLRPGSQPPGPQPGNDFDPSLFNRSQRLDVPFVATDMQAVDAMLALARVQPGDYVIDLGSGDGRILIAAARSAGARGLGVDIDPARVREATANAAAAGVAGRVAFRRRDLFATPLGEADVLTLYLSREVNLRLRPAILAEMRPGTRVVSHDFDMGDWQWDQRQRVGNATIYLWIVPARIGGNWTLTVDGHAFPLVLEQHSQRVYGNAGTAQIEEGRLTGDHVRFIARLGAGRQVFEGRVEGGRLVPLAATADWHAERAPSSSPAGEKSRG
jgi:SAM-dependent methyltransferase